MELTLLGALELTLQGAATTLFPDDLEHPTAKPRTTLQRSPKAPYGGGIGRVGPSIFAHHLISTPSSNVQGKQFRDGFSRASRQRVRGTTGRQRQRFGKWRSDADEFWNGLSELLRDLRVDVAFLRRMPFPLTEWHGESWRTFASAYRPKRRMRSSRHRRKSR